MPAEIVLQQTPSDAALAEGREQLRAVRAALAEREAAVAQRRAQLKIFDGRYLGLVGVLYAELDELEARIAEREVALYDSESARRRAREARERAEETREASLSDALEPVEVEPPPSLKSLFREVARRIHPDFASDEAEGKYFTLLMARANEAYSRGDLETLQRMLDDYQEVSGPLAGEGAGAELLRVMRQVQHARRDIAALDAEEESLLGSELGQLFREAEAATFAGRDLLSELAGGLREQVAEAQVRFERVDRQIGAHGR